MKSLLLFSLIQFSIIVSAVAQEYQPAEQGSSVTFKVKNFGFSVDGSFTGLQGKMIFDPKDPAKALFDVSVDAASVNTDNEQRDNHLKKEEYFDVQNYPRIRFVSTAVTPSGKDGKDTISGKLTIKATTRDISFPFTPSPLVNHVIFSGQFTVNRKQFRMARACTISSSLTLSV